MQEELFIALIDAKILYRGGAVGFDRGLLLLTPRSLRGGQFTTRTPEKPLVRNNLDRQMERVQHRLDPITEGKSTRNLPQIGILHEL